MAIKPLRAFQLPEKNYRQVAVVEILLIFCVLLMGDFATWLGMADDGAAVRGMLLIPEALYLIILYELGKHLQPNLAIRKFLAVWIWVIAACSVVALNPFFSIGAAYIPLLFTVHILLCALECYMIGLGLQDIYLDKLSLKDRLWGSTAVYLLIAIGWASFYELFLLIDHTALGVQLSPGYESYAEALYFSLCSLSGTGSVYTATSHVFRNLALIESVWGVLFLVMLIGRVFTKDE